MDSPLPADPYAALGLSKDCSAADIKKKYRQLALKHHPDKVSDPAAKEEASNLFSAIAGAYEILSDEVRRGRYDAAVKLAELRREAMESRGGARATNNQPTSSPYKESSRPAYTSRASERPTPRYETEERRPSYAPKEDYFDQAPRATARKEPEYERASRKPTHDSKEKSSRSAKESKENERERRREKTRKAERDTRRDRDRKYAPYAEQASESDSDEVARWNRRMREEDDQRRAKEEERRAAKEYYEKAYKQQQEAGEGSYLDERARKMFAASAQAQDYIRSSRSRPKDSDRRPSPQRMGSSKDKYEYVRRSDGRPAAVRRGSERPKTTGRDTESSRKSTPREPERHSSAEKVEELRRPPTLNQTRSSPADIHVPTDKPRAQSLQTDAETIRDIPQVKRAETMPYGGIRRENTAPTKSSGLRQTEFNEGLATPAATPEYNGPSNANSTKYSYGRNYADDMEYPTPDGYKTEVREPRERERERDQGRSSRPTFARKMTRSPSPVKDSRESRDAGEGREKGRTSSARYPTSPQPPPLNTRTTSYVYGGPDRGVEAYDRSRPNSGRGTSPRDAPYLYGEVRPEARPDARPASGSPRQKYGPYSPPDDNVRYGRGIRPEDIKYQTGNYSYKRPSGDRPNMSRHGSSTVYATARA